MSIFKFKFFDVQQIGATQKVGTDAMLLGALVQFDFPDSILDVGTGNGVIALMCAQKFKNAEVFGLDIDKASVEVATKNFINSPFASRLAALKENFLEYRPDFKFDLIVSNPPYFNTKMLSNDSKRNLARHEGSMPLKSLINHAQSLLNERGELWMIIPKERADELVSNPNELNLALKQRIKIFGKPGSHVRDILVFSISDVPEPIITQLAVRDMDANYTDEYIELTKEFHYNKLK